MLSRWEFLNTALAAISLPAFFTSDSKASIKPFTWTNKEAIEFSSLDEEKIIVVDAEKDIVIKLRLDHYDSCVYGYSVALLIKGNFKDIGTYSFD